MSKPSFSSDEAGSVTVDWVVLAAAVVGLGLAVLTSVRGGLDEVSGDIAFEMASFEIETVFRESYSWEEFGVWPLGGDGPMAADPDYVPADQGNYDMIVAWLRSLETDQLPDADAYLTQAGRLAVGAVLESGGTLTDDNRGRVADSEAAVALVLGERGVDRWTGRGASEESTNELAVGLGLPQTGMIPTTAVGSVGSSG